MSHDQPTAPDAHNALRSALQEAASRRFDNERDVERWVAYWADTVQRNEGLLGGFNARILFDFRDKIVLDVGCGTAGLARIVREEDGTYLGMDYHTIVEYGSVFASRLGLTETLLLRGSAIQLPFPNSSVDYIVAFDVIEHLVGGYSWQLMFCQEMGRVLKENGLIFLTTPNRLNPFEGHTHLYFPHYMPIPLANLYIRAFRPSFFKEYSSYAEVHILSPWKLRSLLEESGLKLVHDYPWCMDFEDYPPRRRRILHALRILGGLDWGWSYGYWFAACKDSSYDELKRLKSKDWLSQ